MNIGIWGSGIVGSATGFLLERGHKVLYYDKYKKDSKFVSDEELVRGCEIIFVCVPAPMGRSGEIDLRYLRDSLSRISSLRKKRKIVVIKSSLVSGITRRMSELYPEMDFAFNPEFLREKYSKEDMVNAKRVVIGVDKDSVFSILKKMYRKVFKDIPIIKTTLEEAEAIKYVANVFLAGQVALANELYNICKKLKVDYEKVRRTLVYDNRIGKNIMVPGPDGDFGFGGKCFPKDLNALIYIAREFGYRPYLLEEMWRLNLKVRKSKDWLEIEGAVSDKKFKGEGKNDK